jgi:hypothetical protein
MNQVWRTRRFTKELGKAFHQREQPEEAASRVANNILGCSDRGLPIMVGGSSVVHFPEMNPRFKRSNFNPLIVTSTGV